MSAINKWKPEDGIIDQSNKVIVTRMITNGLMFRIDWVDDEKILYTGACIPKVNFIFNKMNDDGLYEMRDYLMSDKWHRTSKEEDQKYMVFEKIT